MIYSRYLYLESRKLHFINTRDDFSAYIAFFFLVVIIMPDE